MYKNTRQIRKYDTIYQIVDEHFNVRYNMYEQGKGVSVECYIPKIKQSEDEIYSMVMMKRHCLQANQTITSWIH